MGIHVFHRRENINHKDTPLFSLSCPCISAGIVRQMFRVRWLEERLRIDRHSKRHSRVFYSEDLRKAYTN